MEKKIDLRLQKTYQSLHAAFTELLEEKRFEELTVGELCDRAAIRRTTFKVASGSVEREVTLRLRHTFFHRSGV